MRCATLLAAGALAALFGCSRGDAPPPIATPAPMAQPDTGDRAREQMNDAAQQLRADDLANPAPAGGASPAMSDEDMAEARKAIEGMLENVRKELEQKSATLAQPAPPPGSPSAPSPAAPNASSPQP